MSEEQKIVVQKNGPYLVKGGLTLIRKGEIVSEHGEPMAWTKTEELDTKESYALCRCGQSGNKPFCDGTHKKVGFDGTETAETNTTAERQKVYDGSNEKIQVKRDYSLCMSAGFCATRLASIKDMMDGVEESTVRAQIIAMIEKCPSGSFTYAMGEDEPDIEPDYPTQIAAVTEETDEGPIMGPLWVTGYVPVERADGNFFETRNRVTLCRCGLSSKKPLCDGTHRDEHVTE